MTDVRVWKLRTRELPLDTPLLMGVVNVTPDSFSDGGETLERAAAVARGLQLVGQGASIVDVGGESTRPGAQPVDAHEEARRVVPVVAELAEKDVIVSVDTSKPQVARDALDAGAEIVNDVTACADPMMVEVVAGSGSGVVLMHMRGEPRTMQDDPTYEDVVEEVSEFLEQRSLALEAAGVDPRSIGVDPGIGFGKTVGHNLEILRRLDRLVALQRVVVLGASRKSFLGVVTGKRHPADRDLATAVVTGIGVMAGVNVFRVHDAGSSADAAAVATAIVAGQSWDGWSRG